MHPCRRVYYRIWTKRRRARRLLVVVLGLALMVAFGLWFDEPQMGYSLDGVLPSNATLLVTMHTVPRPGVAYLARSLWTLAKELNALAALMADLHPLDPDYRPPTTTVLVVNHRPGAHRDFDRSRDRFPQFTFVDSNALDPVPSCPRGCAGYWGNVTDEIVTMNVHIIEWLRITQSNCTDLVLMAKDDFDFCPESFVRGRIIIEAAAAIDPNFAAIRLSYGMNGVVLHCKDLPGMIRYLQENLRTGPADTLLGYLWTATQQVKDGTHIPDLSLFANRSYFVARNNLMEHFGKVSSRSPQHTNEEDKLLRPADTQLRYPQCFEILNAPGLYTLENFNPEECNMALCRRKNDVVIDSKDTLPNWITTKYHVV